MDSKRIILFDKLIKKNSDAYIKLKDCNVLIYTDFLDFETIKTGMNYYRNKKMKFNMIDELPILLDIRDINKDTFDILYNQLLTGLTPNFNSVDDQICYILLLEQLTGGNLLEIKEMIKSITFNPIIYNILVDYGFNILQQIN